MSSQAPLLRSNNPSHSKASTLSTWAFGLATFAIILGLRIALVAGYGSPAPFWDEWDAEGSLLYPKVLAGDYHLADLFSSHNEHRIVLTKVVFLVLLHFHGVWDPILQMLASALFHGMFAWVLFFFIHAAMPPSGKTLPAFLIAVALTAIPHDHDNAIAGFQSQFEFLQVFSLLSLAVFCLFAPLTRWWWAGWVFLCLSSFSMGSGFFPAPALLVTYCIFAISSRSLRDRPHIIASLLFGLATIAFLAVHFTGLPTHRPEISSMLENLLVFLSWPLPGHIITASLVMAPTLCGLVLLMTGRFKPDHRLTLTVALTVWYLGQVAAISVSRSEPGLPSRYLAISACGLTACCLWVFHLLEAAASKSNPSRVGGYRLLVFLASLWMAGITALQVTHWFTFGLPLLSEKASHRKAHAEMLSEYMRTRNNASLDPPAPNVFPMYPDTVRLASILEHKPLAAILPTEVQPQLTPAAPAEGIRFTSTDIPPGLMPAPVPAIWGTYTSEGQAAIGTMKLQFSRNPDSHWVEFWIAGEPSPKGTSLIVQDMSGKRTVKLHTGPRPGPLWSRVLVEIPYNPFQLVVDDKFDDRWFAVTAPRSVGRLEPLKSWLLRHGPHATAIGILIAVFVLMQRRLMAKLPNIRS